MITAPPSYESRIGLFGSHGRIVVASAIMTAGSVWILEDSPVTGVTGMLFFGIATAILGYPILTRAVLLRVDGTGVGDKASVRPWPEIRALCVRRTGKRAARPRCT